jgi:hypothetical protein
MGNILTTNKTGPYETCDSIWEQYKYRNHKLPLYNTEDMVKKRKPIESAQPIQPMSPTQYIRSKL